MVYKRSNGIEGVLVHPLKIIEDERGAVMHMLRKSDPQFSSFGEVYFSKVNHGFVKGWKRHKKMTQNFAVPFGQLSLVVLDTRQDSSTENNYTAFTIGAPDNYSLVTIPPNLWYAFYSITNHGAILANCADLSHDPSESEQLPLDAFEIDLQSNTVKG